MIVSGKKTIATVGAAQPLGNRIVGGPLMVKALNANTGVVYIGNNGANDVSVDNGLQLAKGESVVFEKISNLSEIYVDVSVNGEGVAWITL